MVLHEGKDHLECGSGLGLPWRSWPNRCILLRAGQTFKDKDKPNCRTVAEFSRYVRLLTKGVNTEKRIV